MWCESEPLTFSDEHRGVSPPQLRSADGGLSDIRPEDHLLHAVERQRDQHFTLQTSTADPELDHSHRTTKTSMPRGKYPYL